MKPATSLSKTALETIRRQLQQFGEASPGIQLAVLSTADGFEIASFLSPGADAAAAKVAAMTSSITAVGDAITRETGLHGSRNLIIESDNGVVLLLSLREVKPRMALAIVANKQAILGHLLWATRNTGAAIERIATL
jgi:predicted regulator of Ras-like GTPase activity (Roadblock/LC7/MglB family)